MPGATISVSDLAQNEMPGTFSTQKRILKESEKYYFRYELYPQEFSGFSNQKAWTGNKVISRSQRFCEENQRWKVNSKQEKHRLYKSDQKNKKTLNNIQIRFFSCC